MALPSATLSYLGLQYLLLGKNMILLTKVTYMYFPSLMLHRPLQFVDLAKLRTEKSHPAFHPSNDSGDPGLANSSSKEDRWGTMTMI